MHIWLGIFIALIGIICIWQVVISAIYFISLIKASACPEAVRSLLVCLVSCGCGLAYIPHIFVALEVKKMGGRSWASKFCMILVVRSTFMVFAVVYSALIGAWFRGELPLHVSMLLVRQAQV